MPGCLDLVASHEKSRIAAQYLHQQALVGIRVTNAERFFEAYLAIGIGTWLGLPGSFLDWYWLPLLPMFVIFFISALAETNRPPFDLPEAESELVAGFMVEYASTPYLLFMLGEYVAITTMCALTTILFLGGWLPPLDIWPLNLIPGVIWFLLKIIFVFFMFAMVKAMVPRYRYDQLMRLGWKVFLPSTLVAVAVVGGWVVYAR